MAAAWQAAGLRTSTLISRRDNSPGKRRSQPPLPCRCARQGAHVQRAHVQRSRAYGNAHTHTLTHARARARAHTHTQQERDELLVTRGRKWIDINSKTQKEINNAGNSDFPHDVPYVSKWARLDLAPGSQS